MNADFAIWYAAPLGALGLWAIQPASRTRTPTAGRVPRGGGRVPGGVLVLTLALAFALTLVLTLALALALTLVLTLVLTLIRDAGTPDELHGASEMAKRLTSEGDKAEARKHFKARQAAMKRDAEAAAKAQADAEARRREAEEEARLEREAIQAESDGEMNPAAADFFVGEAA